MAIKNTQLTSTSVLQVFSATVQTALTTVIFCNVSPTTSTSINVFAVPFGSSPLPSTQIMKSLPLAAGDTFVLDTERLILEQNDSLWVQSSVSNVVTVTVSSLTTA